MIKIIVGITIILALVATIYYLITCFWFPGYVEKKSLVATSPFLPNNSIPEAMELEKAYPIIKKEVLELRKKGLFAPIQGDLFFGKNIVKDKKWKRFYIKWMSDKLDPLALKHCPETCKIIQKMPNLKTCLFSLLEPGTYIPPHKGPFRGVVRFHLGIDTPNSDKCFISVGGEKYSWRDGKMVLFDDTYEHYVRNDTQKDRIVMFCDFERPLEPGIPTKINKTIMSIAGPITHRGN